MIELANFENPKKTAFWKQALLDYAEEIEWVLKEEDPNIDELCSITKRMKIEVEKHGYSKQNAGPGRDS